MAGTRPVDACSLQGVIRTFEVIIITLRVHVKHGIKPQFISCIYNSSQSHMLLSQGHVRLADPSTIDVPGLQSVRWLQRRRSVRRRRPVHCDPWAAWCTHLSTLRTCTHGLAKVAMHQKTCVPAAEHHKHVSDLLRRLAQQHEFCPIKREQHEFCPIKREQHIHHASNHILQLDKAHFIVAAPS